MPFFGVPIRNGVPIGLGSVAGFGISPFDPSQLFSAGEQGAWYDPSDLSTMFNDAAGTQPITSFTTNQPVGLLVDKSGRGNNATASGSARPVLSKRYNLLTRTEEFDDGAWTKTNVTVIVNAAVAPDGTTTADLVYPTTSGTARYVNRSTLGQTAGTSFKTFIRFKAAGINFAYVYNVQGNSLLYVNLTTGATSNVGSNINNLISSIDGNGWVSVSFDSTITFGSTANWYTGPCDASGSTQVTANGTDGIYIWGADLRRTIDANAFQPAYQRVVTATDYDGDGFLPYLEYSGAQAMATGTITPGAIDTAQVFAGATKLSATTGLVYEFSNNGSINNGAFNSFVDGGGNGTNTIDASLRGTQQTFFANSTFAPPISYVQCVAFDIAGASRNLEIIPRINGVVNQTGGGGAADAGSGNFGNYPLYFGARNSASLFFTGRMYSNIVRFGATLSAAQISATESWVAQRAGVTL